MALRWTVTSEAGGEEETPYGFNGIVRVRGGVPAPGDPAGALLAVTGIILVAFAIVAAVGSRQE